MHICALLTPAERGGYVQDNCVYKAIGNKDFLFQKGKDKVECSDSLFYPHLVREVSSRGCNMAYNNLELFSHAESILLAEEY